MILSIRIKNFQSHKDTTLDLCAGLNVIIGKSDSGKSAIRRALYWVCKNRPTGDSFVSWWGGPTVVELHLSSGDTVSRIKEGNKNLYKINEQEFTAFGTDVPKEVQDILNINDVNLQAQFDRPFLLDASAGEVASHFNRIAKIENIDSSIKKVTGWQKALEKDKSIKEGILENLNVQKSKLDFVEKLDIEVTVLEQMQGEYDNKIKENSKLKKCIEDLKVVNAEISRVEEFLEIEDAVSPLLDTLEDLKGKEQTLSKLKETISSIKKVDETISSCGMFTVMEEDVLAVEKLVHEKEDKYLELQSIKRLIAQIYQSSLEITRAKAEVKDLTEQFDSQFPDICPLCGGAKKVTGTLNSAGWKTVTGKVTPILDKALETNDTNPKKNKLL